MGKKDTGSAEMLGIDELRTNVLVALADTPHPLVAVTSPRGDARRLDAAAALAASVQQTGRRVALVDADVSEPRDGSAIYENAAAVTAQAVTESNAALLVAEDFQRLLADTAAANDLVVVACPPVLDVAETRAVTAACTATVLVASSARRAAIPRCTPPGCSARQARGCSAWRCAAPRPPAAADRGRPAAARPPACARRPRAWRRRLPA